MIVNFFLWIPFLFQLQQRIKHWSKPATLALTSGVLSDLHRSHSDLVVENALLRQQLIVLNRQVKRPQLTCMVQIFHPVLTDCRFVQK
jgi:hypothetical protein